MKNKGKKTKNVAVELTDTSMRNIGNIIAHACQMQRSPEHPDLWLMDGGDRTDLGVFLTLQRTLKDNGMTMVICGKS